MTVFIKPPAYLPPTHKERNPVTAAIIGFLFGGIGLGLYFKSVIDFLIPVGFAVATAVVAAAASAPSGAGFLGGCMIERVGDTTERVNRTHDWQRAGYANL